MNLHFGSLATDIYSGEISATSGPFAAGIGGGANGGVDEQNKVYSGKKLSAEEMRYIKIHYPALYPYVERVQIQRQALEERIKHCHSKEEVQDVYSEAMFHISDDDPAKQMLYAAYDDVLKEFKKTSDYQELPETKEDAEKKKQTKKVSSAEPADETDDIQEDWKNAFLSESTGVSVGTTHTDNHLRPATNPAV